MAKYIKNSGGDFAEESSIGTSSGSGSANLIPHLDAGGKLDQSFMPTGIAADTISIVASEAITAGSFVNIYNNLGVANIRNADANNIGKKAMGYVLSAVSSGASGSVYFDDSNTSVTGQTPGDMFLSITTPGATQTTAPTGSGKIVQRLGIATSSTTIHVAIAQPILLA